MKNKLYLLLLVVVFSCDRPDKSRENDESEVRIDFRDDAERLSRELLIVDAHIDIPYRLDNQWEDISGRTAGGHFDYVRAMEGGLNAAFMSIYIPATLQTTGGARTYADQLIDMVYGFEEKWPEKFSAASSMEDIISDFKAGIISLPMGIENGAAIEDDIRNVTYFYERGIRYITLTHSKWNQICDSSYDTDKHWNGLSPFGREVITEMNRLGMLIDISHVSDSAFFQVIEQSKAPVIATHSSCRYYTPGFERNMSDEMIIKLAEQGGVIHINFGSYFLDEEFRDKMQKVYDYLDANQIQWGSEEQIAYFNQNEIENELPEITVDDVADHISHVASIAGVDCIGLGSDFDGVNHVPAGLDDVSMYPNLIERLLEDGFTEDDIRKICSGNLFRVWTDVNYISENWHKTLSVNH
ncbi:MAG: dipeptidase [Cyclobacteriaceae bacterium]|nr:dipeptidase [Cyclobacteriaceae bacterium]